jgi:hypothetical protein
MFCLRAICAAFFISFAFVFAYSQNVTGPNVCSERNRLVKQTLKPTDSTLRRALDRNDRGDGIHWPWMDLMKSLGVKEANASVSFQFKQNQLILEIKAIYFYDRYYYYASEKQFDKAASNSLDTLKKALHPWFFKRTAGFMANFNLEDDSCGNLSLSLIDDECLPLVATTSDLEVFKCEVSK